MKRVFMTLILLSAISSSMAQEMAADVEDSVEVESSVCTDGTVAGSDCIDLNSHPTIDQTGELLTLLLEKDVKKAQSFCDQSNKQCLAAITPYFKKTPQDYALRSVKLTGDDDLTLQSTIEATVVLGDETKKNQYTFVFEYQRNGANKPWKIIGANVKDMKPITEDDDSEIGIMMR